MEINLFRYSVTDFNLYKLKPLKKKVQLKK